MPRLEKCRCSEEPGELVVEGFLCQMGRGWGETAALIPEIASCVGASGDSCGLFGILFILLF